MDQATVGLRELKAQLSKYMERVQAGATVVVTDRGKPVGRLVPIRPSAEDRVGELVQSGIVAWSGRALPPLDPVAQVRGTRTVAELVLENRE